MPHTDLTRGGTRLAIVGAGRLGNAIARALSATASSSSSSARSGRGADGAGCDAVLLCVPDAEIASAAAAIAPGPIVGHCSGATGLEPLAPHEAFSLHPLMTVTADGADFGGVTAAVDGSTDRAIELARLIAQALEMDAVHVAPEDRAAYHAAASIASNFLVTLEAAAEQLGATRRESTRRDARAAGAGDGRELGTAWRASARSPGRWHAGTRRRSRGSAKRSPSARPSCWRCSTR